MGTPDQGLQRGERKSALAMDQSFIYLITMKLSIGRFPNGGSPLPSQNQSGATLIELLVSIAVAGILMLSGSALMIYMFKKHGDQLKSGHLHSELYPAIGIVNSRIAQAGYWASAYNGEPYNYSGPGPNNPFTANGWDLQVGDSNQCLLFSFDRNRDGVASSDEQIGYRLNSGVLEEGREATTCAAGQWAALTDSTVVNISSLQFVVNTQIVGAFIKRTVNIQLRGALVSVAGAALFLEYTVRVSNDKAS